MPILNDEEYAFSVEARLFYIDDDAYGEVPRIYPHAMITCSTGLGEFKHLVLVHMTMGKARFAFRVEPEKAREFSKGLLDAADRADAQKQGLTQD